MKKFIALLLTVVLMITQLYVFAYHDSTKSVNERYAGYIAEAIENSRYKDEIDKDNIYIIESIGIEAYNNNSEVLNFRVAMPITGTKDIAYGLFRNGEYTEEFFNPADSLRLENYLNTKIDEYIANNNLSDVTEIVNTMFYGRVSVFCYRVIADNEAYFIPYHTGSDYNPGNDEACALELGKAYPAEDFAGRVEYEKTAYDKFLENQKKAEEEKLKAEEEKYIPVVSVDENGDRIITVNGHNLDDILAELVDHIELMEQYSRTEIRVKTDTQNYMTTYRCNKETDRGDRGEIAEFADELFNEIKYQASTGKPDPAKDKSYVLFNLMHVENFKTIHHRVEVFIWEDGVEIEIDNNTVVELSVENSDAIISLLDKYSKNQFSGFDFVLNDDNAPNYLDDLEGMTKTDVVEFEFQMFDDATGSLNKEVAGPGETVKGIFEKYRENKYKSTYILKLSGSKGTAAFQHRDQSSLDGSGEYFSNNIPIAFSDRFRFENNKLVEYKVGKSNEIYELKLVFKDSDISEVYFEKTECDSLKYTQFTEDSKLTEEHTEKDKEVIIKAAKECADTLYDFGLFKGTDKGYELEKSLTREESATILVRLLGEEEKIKEKEFREVFADVDKERWSYQYVMYCYNHNITKGTSASAFSPEVQIDAEQFVTLLMRLLGYTDVNPDTALDKSVEYKLLPLDMVESLKKSETFSRGVMVQIVYNGLRTAMTDGETLAQFLADKDVITQGQASEILSDTDSNK